MKVHIKLKKEAHTIFLFYYSLMGTWKQGKSLNRPARKCPWTLIRIATYGNVLIQNL